MKSEINKYGQFFTEKEMCKYVLDIVNNIKPLKGKVLEPSFGSGNFIDELSNYDVEIEGVEIDEKYYNSYKNSKKNNALLFNFDFMDFNTGTYDFIIGNPPYIELCYSFYNKMEQEVIKNRYKGIAGGRINLVHIFLQKSFDMINDDGIIAFLLPSAILTSPIYKGLRKRIYEEFNIEYLIEDISFKDVAIKVCLLVIRKCKNNGKYLFINNDNYFIMENYEKFNNSATLKDAGFKVNIGEVVWNQKKDLLTDDSNENILVFGPNITNEGIKIGVGSNDGKKQYIKEQSIRYANCIIFPRTVSKTIKYFFVRNNTNMIFENHVLVVSNENIELLNKFHSKLEEGVYDELLTSFFNSSNLTKTELLSMPF